MQGVEREHEGGEGDAGEITIFPAERHGSLRMGGFVGGAGAAIANPMAAMGAGAAAAEVGFEAVDGEEVRVATAAVEEGRGGGCDGSTCGCRSRNSYALSLIHI